MRWLYYLILGVLFACGSADNNADQQPNTEEPVLIEDPEKPVKVSIDRSQYIDERIAGDIQLDAPNPTEKEGQVYALKGEGRFLVEKYQGTLMKASGAEGGFSLKFEPYSFLDDVTDQMINSPYNESIRIYLSKEQNETLHFVDYSEATKNLAWDYFENLFTVYYFTDGELNYPLKFMDEGKTEWDG